MTGRGNVVVLAFGVTVTIASVLSGVASMVARVAS